MARFRKGRVIEVLEERGDLVRVEVEIDDRARTVEAVGFPDMLGPLAPDDMVVVNTLGIDLALGTGGAAFILWNLSRGGTVDHGDGHIVKLRYTPWQMNVLAAEAPESQHHATLEGLDSIDGTPVVACSLHSQVAAVAAGVKAARPSARVGYLMTDGAALPIAWSRLVGDLRGAGLLDATVTAGHAFGGDLEAVNAFSGLATLAGVKGVDVIVASMGPGVVGTGTLLGHTAIEQGQLLDAATALGGRAVAALRISFADERERHAGVSHHSLTALRLAAREPATIAVPRLPADRAAIVTGQLQSAGLRDRHRIVEEDGGPGLDLLADRGIEPSSMGRPLRDIPELFLAGAAAGAHAAALLPAP